MGKLDRLNKAWLVLAAAALLATVWPQVSESKTQIKAKKKYVDENYPIRTIKRIAIYPIAAEPKKKHTPSKGFRRWEARGNLPADSVLLSYAEEIASHIRHEDSSVHTVVLDPPDSIRTDAELVAIARDSLGAEVVILARATALYTENARRSGAVPNLLGGGPIWVPGEAAKAVAKIRFTMTDASSGELIWRVVVEGEREGDNKEWDSKSAPPALGALLAEVVISAASSLPF